MRKNFLFNIFFGTLYFVYSPILVGCQNAALDGAASTLPPTSVIVSLSAGRAHTAFLTQDGTVWSFGANSDGQYGDGTFVTTANLIKADTANSIKAISAGYDYTLALDRDGTVWGWGSNEFGQIGDGDNTISSPSKIPNVSNVVAISAGYGHSIALKSDGTVWSWGRNNYGQLGDGTLLQSSTPVQAVGLSGVKAISSGVNHSLAVKEDGTVWAWGNNSMGQLGNGTTVNSPIPVQVTGLTGVTNISAGLAHSLALRYDGTVWAWGYNMYYQLGDGTDENKSMPNRISGLSNVIYVNATNFNSIALTSDGTVWTWGLNGNGQLGNGTNIDSSIPSNVRNLTGAIAVSAGIYHVAVLKNDGSVWTWGSNNNGQLGDHTVGSRSLPQKTDFLRTVMDDDSEPPSPPSIIAIATSESEVIIKWQPVAGAEYYNIYFSTSTGVTCTNGIKTSTVLPQYSHSGLTPDVRYFYVVTAVNISGIESFPSEETAATPHEAVYMDTSVISQNELQYSANEMSNPYSSYLQYDNRNAANCLSKENIAAKFRPLTTNDVGRLRRGMLELYQCSDDFFQYIPFDLDYFGKLFLLANYVSHNMAPYGPNGDGYYTQWATLNCDEYAYLALIFFRSVALVDGDYNGHDRIFGFEGQNTGSHAQLIYESKYYSLFSDPTTGIATPATYDDIFAGIPIENSRLARFYSYYDSESQPSYMNNFSNEMANLLLSGGYDSVTVLYNYKDVYIRQ